MCSQHTTRPTKRCESTSSQACASEFAYHFGESSPGFVGSPLVRVVCILSAVVSLTESKWSGREFFSTVSKPNPHPNNASTFVSPQTRCDRDQPS